jgi:hypothetical protein
MTVAHTAWWIDLTRLNIISNSSDLGVFKSHKKYQEKCVISLCIALTIVRTGTPVSIGTENRDSGFARDNKSFSVS